MLTVFLASMDQTIAAVALPTIVKDIGGESGYSWIGSAYMLSKPLPMKSRNLTLTCSCLFSDCMYVTLERPSSAVAERNPGLSPLYGKLSDLVGRKPILFFSIFVFLLGSALCGAAQSFIWLALCKFFCPYISLLTIYEPFLEGRGVQGIGGGGIVQMTLITIADISELCYNNINQHI